METASLSLRDQEGGNKEQRRWQFPLQAGERKLEGNFAGSRESGCPFGAPHVYLHGIIPSELQIFFSEAEQLLTETSKTKTSSLSQC